MGALRLADHRKTEPTLQPSDLAQLRQTIRGDLVVPGDSGYEQARRVWNGMVDKRPAAVIYCTGSDDVITARQFRQNAKPARRRSRRWPQRRRLFGMRR